MDQHLKETLDNTRKLVVTILITIHLSLSSWLLFEIHRIGLRQVQLITEISNLNKTSERLIDAAITAREREMEHIQKHLNLERNYQKNIRE